MNVRLGTRSSKLAVWQTMFVAERLRMARPDLEVRVVHISTHGDENQDRPLPEIGGKGLFTEKIEESLRQNEIDAAVHSLKDLPVDESPGLTVAAVLGREEARDVLVSRAGVTLSALPAGAVVGTSSTRREAQLRAMRPDLVVKPIRGNVETRIGKVDRGDYDATLMAGAGVVRLGLAGRVSEWIDVERCMPAPGQGAMAVQCRAGDARMLDLLALIDDPLLRRATGAEREFLRSLGGGCAAPIAAFARFFDGEAGRIFLQGSVISLDGRRVVKVSGKGDDPRALAKLLADQARAAGAEEILKPLSGKRVLVTRPRGQASNLVAMLCQRGALPVEVPLIRIEPAGDAGRTREALDALSSYDWVIFTSANGVEHFLGRLGNGEPAITGLSPKVAAVGPATAEALRHRGITPALTPAEHTGAALARGILEAEAGSLQGKRVLFPCAVDHTEDAAGVLRGAGAAVDELPVYRTAFEEPGPEELDALEPLDAVLFLSGSAARAFQGLADRTPSLQAALSRAVVGCIGPQTARVASEAGMKVDVMPPEHTAQALVDALEKRFGRWTSL